MLCSGRPARRKFQRAPVSMSFSQIALKWSDDGTLVAQDTGRAVTPGSPALRSSLLKKTAIFFSKQVGSLKQPLMSGRLQKNQRLGRYVSNPVWVRRCAHSCPRATSTVSARAKGMSGIGRRLPTVATFDQGESPKYLDILNEGTEPLH